MRAALYARISQDEHGTQQGVRRQLDDARALAVAKGWEVAGEYVDNDVSAYTGAKRDGYDRLIADAGRGVFDRIVVYQSSRLWRGRLERAQAMDVLAGHRISVAAVQGPELDLSTAYGSMIAGIMGEFDTAESAVKGERVKRAAQQRAEEGRASGPVLYGWRREYILGPNGERTGFRDVEDHDQADVVREIVRRLLADDPLREIVRDLNDRGVPVPSGRDDVAWRSSTARKLAWRPANIGERVHHGGKRRQIHAEHNLPFCGPPCVIGPADWPAIVDEDAHHAVRAMLADPRRRTNRGASQRVHLLTSGIGRCGVCGADLRIRRQTYRPKREGAEPKRYVHYICAGKSGCVGRDQAPVDALAEAVVVERLARPDLIELFRPPPPSGREDDADRVADLRQRLDAAAEDYADGLIDRDQLRAITARLRPELEEAERIAGRDRTAPDMEPLHDLLDADDVVASWASMDVNRKRAVMQCLGMTVSIMPTRQGPGFKPEDVTVEWGTA